VASMSSAMDDIRACIDPVSILEPGKEMWHVQKWKEARGTLRFNFSRGHENHVKMYWEYSWSNVTG
jgi:hypothetical protein